jgi:hypothetical protein
MMTMMTMVTLALSVRVMNPCFHFVSAEGRSATHLGLGSLCPLARRPKA